MKLGLVTSLPMVFLVFSCAAPDPPLADTEQALDGTLLHARACAVRAAYEAASLGDFEPLEAPALPVAIPTGAGTFARFVVPDVGRVIVAEDSALSFYTESGHLLVRAMPSVPLTWQSVTGDELRCGTSASSSPPPHGPVSCERATVCTTGAGAVDLGSVAGDDGADTVSVTGSTSTWIKVVVTEESSGIFSSSPLRMRATLTSPPGANFDLFVHTSSCTTPTATSEKPAGQVDVASVSQPETGTADDFYALLEVRHIGAEACNTNAKWTLKVEGNR